MSELTKARSGQNHAQESSFAPYEPLGSAAIKQRIFPATEGVAPQTGVFYQRALNHFKDFVNIHDDQVLLDFSPKVIKQMIIDYILYLRDEKTTGKKLSRNSIKSQLSGILHWFHINNDDFNLTSKNFRIHLPSDDSIADDRPYKTNEVEQILKGCDKRSAAVIHLLCSGLRIGAIHSMLVGHLIEISYQGTRLYKVRVYAGTRSEYYSLTTPEGYAVIKDYLDERTRNKEQLKDKSPLIREQYNKDNPFTINSPKHVTQKAIEWLVENRLKAAGMRKPKEVHLSHAMRKRFATECELSGMKPMIVSTLMGHSTGVRGKYFKPTEKEVLQDFMTHAVDALTISNEYRLKKRNEELETGQAQEIDRLKTQLEEKDRQLRQTVEALEIKSKNSIDKIEKEIIKLNDMIVEVTTDNVHGYHAYRYKDLNGNELPSDGTTSSNS